MRKLLTITAATLLVSATAAMAGGHQGNSGLARAMADSLKSGNATIGRDLGSKGKGTASAVSGNGNGGWGNIGSQTGVAGGGQVSDRGGERGK